MKFLCRSDVTLEICKLSFVLKHMCNINTFLDFNVTNLVNNSFYYIFVFRFTHFCQNVGHFFHIFFCDFSTVNVLAQSRMREDQA